MDVQRWNPTQQPVTGYWGPVTTSIDWCELNYEHSYYIAEATNTLTNIGFIGLAVFGMYKMMRERMPARFILAQMGIAAIGIGSLIYHMTLQWRFQQWDELPMDYSATLWLYLTFSTTPKGQKRPAYYNYIPYILTIFILSLTAAYLSFPTVPILHQAAFASIMLTAVARIWYLLLTQLQNTPEELERNRRSRWMIVRGMIVFLSGFAIWNVDNLACGTLTSLRQTVGYPTAFLLEGHAWWHILTGYGAYLLSVGLSYLSACIEDESVEIRSLPGGWLPWVGRTTVERKALPDEKSPGGNSIAMDRNVSGTGYGSSNESGYVKENGKVKD